MILQNIIKCNKKLHLINFFSNVQYTFTHFGLVFAKIVCFILFDDMDISVAYIIIYKNGGFFKVCHFEKFYFFGEIQIFVVYFT